MQLVKVWNNYFWHAELRKIEKKINMKTSNSLFLRMSVAMKQQKSKWPEKMPCCCCC